MEFSDILEDLIQEKNISLRKISQMTNLSAMQLSKYLHGSIPNINSALILANYFNCSLDYLFGLSNIKKSIDYNNFELNKFITRYEKLLIKNNTNNCKFSRKCDFSESLLRYWKNGGLPKMENIIKIATNLGTSIEYLIGRVD